MPLGARQSEADGELTLEQPAEGCTCVGSDGFPAVERGRACMCLKSAWYIREIEWYRVVIRLYKNVFCIFIGTFLLGGRKMNGNNEAYNIISQAKESFENVLVAQKYREIIKDDRHLELLLQMLEISGKQEILDIGTGTGYLAFPLAERYRDSNVIGLDIAENIIQLNNRVAKEKGFHNLEFVAFDGVNYPFNRETFDVMVTRYAIHHFPKIEETIKQLFGLIKYNGRILISDPMRDENDTGKLIDKFMEIKRDGHVGFYTLRELENLFADNGFILERHMFTKMSFPFPKKQEYKVLYEKLSEEEKGIYDIHMKEDVVWIGKINVMNVIFEKTR